MDDQRLDKWLWCTRFYKTRNLAQEAIKAGHVSVDGQCVKPAKLLTPEHRITLRRPPYEYHLEVVAVASQRGSATLAQTLYRETDASRRTRERLSEDLKLSAVPTFSSGKLDKRARRARNILKRTAGDCEGLGDG